MFKENSKIDFASFMSWLNEAKKCVKEDEMEDDKAQVTKSGKNKIVIHDGDEDGDRVTEETEPDDEEAERKAKLKAALAATDHVAKGGMQKKGYTGSTYNSQKKVQKEELELEEAEDWELKKIHGEYKHLKSLPTSDVLKKHKAQNRVSASYSSAEMGGKEGLISDIMRNRHGQKRMDAYHSLPKKHKDALSEEIELDEGTKPGQGSKPGWMLKADPELAKKLAANITKAKARQKSYGDPSAGKSVKEEIELDEEQKIKVSDIKAALKNVKNASDHTKKMIKANPTQNMPYDSSRHAAYSEEFELDEAFKPGDKVTYETSKYSKDNKGVVHSVDGEHITIKGHDMLGKPHHIEVHQGFVKKIREEADLDESILGDKNDGAYKAGHQPKGRVVKGKSYGAEYNDDEDEKKAAPSGEKRGRGRPKKGADQSGEVKKYTFHDLLNKLSH